MAGDRAYCSGCREDYYNGPGNSTKGECWNLESAKVVERYQIGWWTEPDSPGAFTKVITNSCHRAPGRYAMQETVPDFAVDVRDATVRESR